MYSTTRNRDSVNQSYLNEANYYIVKPPTIEGLEDILRKLMKIDWNPAANRLFDNFVIA